MDYQRVDGVIEQELDDHVLLFRPGTSDVLHLNEVARDVWALLEEPTSRPELARTLSTAYGVDEQRVAGDLAPVLDTLLAHGVVVECTA